MRDLPASRDLLALARELLLGELAPLLPPERLRDAHLVATVIAIALRESDGANWQREVAALVQDLYCDRGAVGPAPHPNPLPACGERERSAAIEAPRPVYGEREGPAPQAWEGEGQAEALRRLAVDLRNGAFENSPSRAAAARAILWRLTIAKLRENNPHFLAANGFGEEWSG